jgi:hypothetical protein
VAHVRDHAACTTCTNPAAVAVSDDLQMRSHSFGD